MESSREAPEGRPLAAARGGKGGALAPLFCWEPQKEKSQLSVFTIPTRESNRDEQNSGFEWLTHLVLHFK